MFNPFIPNNLCCYFCVLLEGILIIPHISIRLGNIVYAQEILQYYIPIKLL